jgi:hypothetical protein
VFGEAFIAAKNARSRRPASAPPKRNTVKGCATSDRSAAGLSDARGYSVVHSALRRMGWQEREVRTALSTLERNETLPSAMDSAALLRAALALLPTAGGR